MVSKKKLKPKRELTRVEQIALQKTRRTSTIKRAKQKRQELITLTGENNISKRGGIYHTCEIFRIPIKDGRTITVVNVVRPGIMGGSHWIKR